MATADQMQVGKAQTTAAGLLSDVLQWRCIGPPRGGRVVAVAGHPSDPNVFYFGACAGGVWKTTDGGTYWENVSDGFFNTAAVGAIAVADSDPNVIYAGTGEACIRNDVSHGDGVYKSTDGGSTWEHKGLKDTRHIGRIRVHPKDPDLVYVAALGHAFGPNRERGVFRSKDGGDTWDLVLFKSEKAGAVDLSMDPHNPRVLYAAIWQARRTFWEMSSGGPDSGLYKSVDGGDTWTELTENSGMPDGAKGRIGVAVSPAKSGRVWALIEAKDGGLFRSDDSGATWEKLTDNPAIGGRAWYYSHIFADPQDSETLWALCWQAWKSTDGGRTFEEVTMPHADNHDLWIDPLNPRRMIEGNDGGACVSFNGGDTWSTIYNQPTAEFYHVATDSQFPYRVYATQQDNSAISVPSHGDIGAILWGDCYLVGSSESGQIAVKPDDANIVYSGAIGSTPGGGAPLFRYDHRTKQVRAITVWPETNAGWPPRDQKYRFAWSFPIAISPHDSNTLYTAANVAFKSTDEGTSWEPISPDLTRDDPTKQAPRQGISTEGGQIETYCTIFAFVESPHESGVLWAGTDDGLVHISRDGGTTWEDVTPADLPEWTMVCMIEVSPHDAATAYFAATRYKLDDFRPLLYKTSDYGRTWHKITEGIPEDDFTRVIREDPSRRGLLYAGTETGVHISLDDGASWQPLRLKPSAGSPTGRALPVVPVYDMVIKDNDLVAGTHGRSFWILDDLTPLRQITDAALKAPAHLFKPAPTYRLLRQLGLVHGAGPGKNYSADNFGTGGTYYEKPTANGKPTRVFLDAGENRPVGAIVTYYLKEQPEDELTLTFLDSKGQHVKTFSSRGADGERLWARAGANRFVWDLRYPDAEQLPGDNVQDRKSLRPNVAPLAPPGTYRIELSVGGQSYSESFEVLKDPRSPATQEELEEQFNLLISIRDRMSEARLGVRQTRRVRQQVEEWERRAQGRLSAAPLLEAAQRLKEKLSTLEDKLITVVPPGRTSKGLPSRLTEKLEALVPVVSSTDAGPTKQSYDLFAELSAALGVQLRTLQTILDTDLARFTDLVRELQIPDVAP